MQVILWGKALRLSLGGVTSSSLTLILLFVQQTILVDTLEQSQGLPQEGPWGYGHLTNSTYRDNSA